MEEDHISKLAYTEAFENPGQVGLRSLLFFAFHMALLLRSKFSVMVVRVLA